MGYYGLRAEKVKWDMSGIRLNRVLHPEILYDRRGSIVGRQLLKTNLSFLRYSEVGFTTEKNGELSARKGEIGEEYLPSRYAGASNAPSGFLNVIGTLSVLHNFKKQNGNNYLVGNGFGSDLLRIDRKIPLEYLPNSFTGYFALPPGLIKFKNQPVTDVYAYYGNNLWNPDSENNEGKELRLAFFFGDIIKHVGLADGSYIRFPMRAEKVKTIIGDATRYNCYSGGTKNQLDAIVVTTNEIARLVLNAILYIHSEDPVTKRILPILDPTLSVKKCRERKRAQQAEGLENHCTIPIIFLNHNFHKRTYSVDSTIVATHPRWQPCGPGFSKVKLIWVTEHERHYKNSHKEKTTEQTEVAS